MENKPVTIKKDPWLTEILGKDTFSLVFHGLSKNDFLRSQIHSESFFAFTKLNPEDIDLIHQLSCIGFRLVDTQVAFSKRIAPAHINPNVTVCLATPQDEEAVAAIAENNFKFSRFHADRTIGTALANKVKREWVRNFFKGSRGDELFVAKIDGIIRGFNQVIRQNDDTVVIDLIATDSAHLRKGVGTALISACENHYSTCKQILVGTQLSNQASIRLYEKYGFRFHSAKHVLHFHST